LLSLLLLEGVLQVFILGDLRQRIHDKTIEVLCLFHQHLLNIEEVPVLPDREQEIVEEVVESVPQVVTDLNNMRAQLNFVALNALADETTHRVLALLYFGDRALNFHLDGLGCVKFVERVHGHNRMEQVSRIQAATTHFFLVLQTKQDVRVSMGFAFLGLSSVDRVVLSLLAF
jgi:hypothetical protein